MSNDEIKLVLSIGVPMLGLAASWADIRARLNKIENNDLCHLSIDVKNLLERVTRLEEDIKLRE